jgi:nitrogen fixation protein NifB
VDASAHPCFNEEARHQFGRVHLPVAPKCNVQCNYCNRQFDCVNESRPGVTSAVLLPKQAVEYLKVLTKKLSNLSVVGIAGPGDPFANADETLETLRLVKQAFPDKILCLSTNGLNVIPYIKDLVSLGVSNVTVTLSAIDEDIISNIYAWVRFEKKMYQGKAAAPVILEQQLKAIKLLKDNGMIVKVNSIILPGINEHHLDDVARKIAELGADLMNCIPLLPNKDTAFEDIIEPDKKMIAEVQKLTSRYIKPMTHCARCRADAAGLLGQEDKEVPCIIKEIASRPEEIDAFKRPYVAVATSEGLLVNQHLGEADKLSIFSETTNGYYLVEQRDTPGKGGGDIRWMEMARNLSDCRAIMVSGVGSTPKNILQSSGIRVMQMTGLIDEGLDAIYKGSELRTAKKNDTFSCGGSCKGSAQGCG